MTNNEYFSDEVSERDTLDDDHFATTSKELLSHLSELMVRFSNILSISKKNSIASSIENIKNIRSIIPNDLSNPIEEKFIKTISYDFYFYNKKIEEFSETYNILDEIELTYRTNNLIDNIFQMSISNSRLLKFFYEDKNIYQNENEELKIKITSTNNKLKEKNEIITKLKIKNESSEKELEDMNDKLTDIEIQLNDVEFQYNVLHASSTDMVDENTKLKEDLLKRQSVKTNDIFEKSSNKYKKLEFWYRFAFIVSVVLFPILSVLTILFKQNIIQFIDPSSLVGSNEIEFWTIKISIILIGITLISYFLKLSSHYQKLAEQNHQTHIELDALPQFVSDLHTDDIRNIKKDLTLKYFGRELDGSPHKDISNLLSDQMKNATELVKASAEMIKGINQPTTKPTEPSKPKDTGT